MEIDSLSPRYDGVYRKTINILDHQEPSTSGGLGADSTLTETIHSDICTDSSVDHVPPMVVPCSFFSKVSICAVGPVDTLNISSHNRNSITACDPVLRSQLTKFTDNWKFPSESRRSTWNDIASMGDAVVVTSSVF